tara:strand:- start:970 stop:1425 length:456 start_codon:yes stop_codon:yes gene_type:complete
MAYDASTGEGMANDRGKTLAARIRGQLEKQEDDRLRAAADQASRGKRMRREREQLFKDLFAFGDAIGHIEIKSREGMLRFRFEKKELRFDADGKEDCVRVSGGDVPDRTTLFIQEELNLWVVQTPNSLRKASQDLLFDTGLEQLMRLGLGI